MKKILFLFVFSLIFFTFTSDRAHAQTITGLGVIGDDWSDEYRANDDRGGQFSTFTKNWLEQLVQYRNINAGEWGCYGDSRRCGYEYNWAQSGASSASLIESGQHIHLAEQIASGEISDVVIEIGNNDYSLSTDFYSEIYNETITQVDLNAKETQIINNIQSAIQTIHDAGEVNIIVISIYDPSQTQLALSAFADPIKRGLVTASINRVNTVISNFATNLNAIVIDPNIYELDLLQSINEQGEFLYGNVTLQTFNNDNDPHHFRLDDLLHPGTVYSGLIANDFFIQAQNLGFGKNFQLFSENEILTHAGLDLNNLTPTATPTNGQGVCETDINQDGVVDVTDYGEILLNYLKNPILNPRADINQDSVVDISDYVFVIQYYMQTCTQ